MPGSSDSFGIGKFAAQRHLTGAGIDRGVGEQQLAFVRIDLAVVENEAHPAAVVPSSSAPVSNSRRSWFSSAADWVKSA